MKTNKKMRAKHDPPDIKIDSRSECPYSTVFALTPEGEEELKLHHLHSAGPSGGYVICNLDLLDLIDDVTQKGMRVE